MKQKGLGRGLDAIFGSEHLDARLKPMTEMAEISVSAIFPNPTQPRTEFDEEALEELADSIRTLGVIQPITVKRTDDGRYLIISGERRWRAARMAGLTQVPAVVIEADDRKAMELAMIENLQREDLNPMEEAEGYRTLMEQYGLTQEETSQRVGKSRSAVANALRLLNLSKEVRVLVEEGKLSGGHARALVPLTEEMQKTAAALIIKDDLSVRQTELLVKKLTAEKKDAPAKDVTAVDYAAEAARELGERLGRPCKIVTGKKKGRIELEYYGVDDLNALLDALHQLKK